MKVTPTVNFYIITFLIFLVGNAYAQVTPEYLRKNAVEIGKLTKLNNDIYDLLLPYRYFAMGEMHGTVEPAEFTIALANLFTSKGDSILVGMEIEEKDMQSYFQNPIDENILKSHFFCRASDDGRANQSWAGIISTLNNNPLIKLFFYDNMDESVTSNRDSLMYLNIKKHILQNVNHKLISLSGNIHNMIKPYKENPKMTLYIKNDPQLNLSDKTCSISHIYQKGTMLNSDGSSLKLREVDYAPSVYSSIFEHDNYFVLYPKSYGGYYDAFLFTRNVTAATLPTK